MTGYEVDPGVLKGIAGTLRNASSDLDQVGNSVPEIPEAGDATPALAAILAQLTDNAGQLVLGLAAAGESVSSAGTRYADDDAAARDTFAGAEASGSTSAR